MRRLHAWHILAPVALVAACHLDRLVNGSGGGGGGGGGPPAPGPPTTLAFTVQPRGAMRDSSIKPPVQVTARDSAGNTATNFTGTIRVAIAMDGSALKNAKLAGDTSVTAVAGVATFTGLTIDQIGTGYTLGAALATGASMGTSAPFDVDSGPPPPPPPSGDITVTTSTSGSNQPSGYTVTVDGGQSKSIPASGTATYSGLTATTHSVQLNGVPSNCTVSEANPQTVSVPANGTGQASFTITCTAPPNQPPVVTAGGNQSVLVGAQFTLSGASFSDPDHNGPWTVKIDWGDGSSDVNTMSNEGSIAGSHSYVTALPATFTVTITVTDAGGLSGSASKTVSVTTL
ncbi:MAG TPA: PKD domain-containing protein [Gemmatimonadales bacterium]|nr:PKD domain-containing protein [Gemmatimonadales bacterium]